MPLVDELGLLGLPPPTIQYPNLKAIKTVLQAHAAENGYAIKVVIRNSFIIYLA
jgi:hypothetical protein